ALDNYGVSPKGPIANSWLLRFSRISINSETFRLSIRNVFRQRTRLIMTLGLLAAGGAMFMTALNVSEAWNENLKKIYIQRLYDMEIRLNNPAPVNAIVNKVKLIPGVHFVEGWSYSSTSFAKENTAQARY